MTSNRVGFWKFGGVWNNPGAARELWVAVLHESGVARSNVAASLFLRLLNVLLLHMQHFYEVQSVAGEAGK